MREREQPPHRATCATCNGTGSVLSPRWVGWLVRTHREARGMGLRELARQVGCSASFLSDVELGRRGLAGPTGRRIAEKLGLREVLQ